MQRPYTPTRVRHAAAAGRRERQSFPANIAARSAVRIE